MKNFGPQRKQIMPMPLAFFFLPVFLFTESRGNQRKPLEGELMQK